MEAQAEPPRSPRGLSQPLGVLPPAASCLSAYPSAALHHRLLPDPRCGRCSLRRAKGPGRTRRLDSAQAEAGPQGGGAGSLAPVPPRSRLSGRGPAGGALYSFLGRSGLGLHPCPPGPDAVGAHCVSSAHLLSGRRI